MARACSALSPEWESGAETVNQRPKARNGLEILQGKLLVGQGHAEDLLEDGDQFDRSEAVQYPRGEQVVIVGGQILVRGDGAQDIAQTGMGIEGQFRLSG